MEQESHLSWINSRRSIRRYREGLIPDNDISNILNAAMHAPSAANCQPWHFIVTSKKEIFNKIVEIHPHASFLSGASHAILVCGDKILQHDDGYYQLDCGAATQNILLAAHSLGIGSCWIGIHPREKRMSSFKSIFGLPDHIEAFALVSLGYPGEKKNEADRYQHERIRQDHW